MIRSLKAAVAALLLLVLSTVAAHATASGAMVCTGVSTNFQNVNCPDANEEFANANLRGIINLGSISGTNTITANATPFALTAYVDGQNFQIKPANTISGAATLNINGIGAKAIASPAGVALGSGDLQSSTIYLVRYYGADDHFRVITTLGTGTASASNAYLTIGNTASLSAERAITAGTCITGTDGGANSTYTVAITSACVSATQLGTDSVSADELNATGVEAELEAVIDLQDLQGAVTAGQLTAIDSSAELRSLMTDELGTGVLFFTGAPASDDQVFVSTSTSAGAWGSIPDSDGATQKLQYDAATNGFIAGTDDDVPDAADYSNLTGGTGIVNSPTGTVAFSFTDKGADPALAADECVFSGDATSNGELVCEGDTANTFETRVVITDPTADRTFTIPDANSVGLTDADKGDITVGTAGTDFQIDAGTVGTTEAAALDTADVTTGTWADARVDGTLEADELVLAGDVDGTANANDIDEAAIEAEIEPTLDTLANLISIQGQTVTLADAGANAFFGWDDVAGAYENLTTAEAEAIMEPLIDTLANLTSVQGQTVTLTDDGFDVLAGWDDSDGAYESLSLAEFATEAAPAAGDYLVLYGAEGDVRKVNWSSLPGVGGGINNVSEDASPTLGGHLEGNSFTVGTSGSQVEDIYLGEGAEINWDAGDCTLTQTGNSIAFAGCTMTGASIDAATETTTGVVELATTGEAETGTDTTRAVTAAGLKAAISGQHTIYVPAGAMIAETTTGCAPGTVESATNLVMYKTMDCDGAGSLQEGVQFSFGMPKSADEGTVTMRVDWTAASGSGNVIWLLSCLARSNDDAIDTAFGTEISVTDTVLTALDVHQAPESGAITAGGTPAENDNWFCRVQRDGDNASDTLNSVDAKIIGVRVLYGINNFTDD